MANVQSARIRPAFAGMNSEASPEYVPDNQAAVLENLLPRPGKVVLRGPISSGINLPGFAGYSQLRGAQVLDSGFHVDISTFHREVQSGVVSTPGGVANPGNRWCSLGLYSYAIPEQGQPLLLKWDGAGVNVQVANGPNYSDDVTTHLSRLFTLSRELGENELRWSDVGGPVADTAAEWADDVSGLDNLIVIGERNDRNRALAHVGKQLAILKSRSIYMLTGLTPSTFAVNRVTNEWGCVSRESVVDHDEGCYFLSERGFAYFDGSSVVDVSGDVKTELLQAIRDAPYPFYSVTSRYGASGILPFARAANVGRDCIMLTIGREDNNTAVAPIIYFCGVYDTKQRSWSKFSSTAFTVGAPVFFIPTPPTSYYNGATLGYDARGNLMYLDDLVAPESSASTLGGEDVVNGTTASIPSTSRSRIIQLSSPGRASQLKRLLLDYTFLVVADGETSVDCWSVSLVDGQGNTLLAATPVQATILASGYTDAQRRAALVRKRFQVECFAEASEVQLRITLPTLDTGVTEVIAAEIHDATVEFIPGRDRPTS